MKTATLASWRRWSDLGSAAHRKSSESWANLLRDCAHRGMRPPYLAVGAGPPGFWKALREVLPKTREQRWRAVNAPHLVVLVRAGARFERDVPAEHDQVTAA